MTQNPVGRRSESDSEKESEDPVPHEPENEDELVDKESADSFPASDPPSY